MQRALRIVGAMHNSACLRAAAHPSSVLQVLWLGVRLEPSGAGRGWLLLHLLLHLQQKLLQMMGVDYTYVGRSLTPFML
jgi:hypothetical protein